MKKVATRALIGLFLMHGTAAIAADEPKMGMGVGGQTCGEFADAYRRDPHIAETIYFTWAQGFMSGQNVLVVLATGKTVDLSAVSLTELEARIRDYCDAHPLAVYYFAVENVYRSLPSPPVVTAFFNSVAGAPTNAKP